jgi:hypothetical protein
VWIVELSFEVLLNRGVMKDRSILWGIILQQVYCILTKIGILTLPCL